MISKYNSQCYLCGLPTKANVDEYDLDNRRSFHTKCLPLEEGKIDCDEIADPVRWCDANGWIKFDWSAYYDRNLAH